MHANPSLPASAGSAASIDEYEPPAVVANTPISDPLIGAPVPHFS